MTYSEVQSAVMEFMFCMLQVGYLCLPVKDHYEHTCSKMLDLLFFMNVERQQTSGSLVESQEEDAG